MQLDAPPGRAHDDLGLPGLAGSAGQDEDPGLTLVGVVHHDASLDGLVAGRPQRADADVLAAEGVQEVPVVAGERLVPAGVLALHRRDAHRRPQHDDGRSGQRDPPQREPLAAQCVRGVCLFLFQNRQDARLQGFGRLHLVRRPGERGHPILERGQVPAARHAPAQMPAHAGLQLLGERPQHVVGEVLAHVVTAHAAPPATRGA